MLRKTIKKTAVVFLVFAFVLIPIRRGFLASQIVKAIEIPEDERWQDYDNYILIDEDTTWNGHIIYNDPYKPVVVANGATLTIEKGTQIEILNLEVDFGRIVAEGTAEEKITFTKAVPVFSDGYKPECSRGEAGMIRFSETGWLSGYDVEPSIMRYVEFNNMGSYTYIDRAACACPYLDGSCQSMRQNIFPRIFNTANAAEWPDVVNPVLKFEYGNLHIENSSFNNNSYADIEVEMDYYFTDERVSSLEVVNSNFEGNSEGTALISSAIRYAENEDPIADKSLVKLKNNWYGHIGGPKVAPDYLVGGEMIKGDYTLEGFRSNNLIVDPVIIIPGILGSSSEYIGGIGGLKLDPIMHTFDNLIASFKKNGYTANQNLFEFPYEWRKSNVLTAVELKTKIQDVKNQTKVSKVDLVTHSMGGLVSRYYIEGANYQNDIDQLITLGTPHKGAPKTYLQWEAGEGFFTREEKIAKKIFSLEAYHFGYNDLGEYIREKVVSVGELLPDYNYLKENGEMRNYPAGYPRNEFLEDLNKAEGVNKLESVNFVNIVGNISNEENTVSGYRVIDSEKWQHGMPENFNDTTTDRGIEFGRGDETVPLTSAEGIITDKKIEIDSAHNDLPTKAQCEVIKELMGKADCEYVNTFKRISSILTFGVFSPIDIQVIAPDGKKVGKDFTTGEIINEIEGAYYTGSGTENEFLTIPNPLDGEYKILTQGTGEGEYKIEAAKITEDPATGMASESVAEITGTTTLEQEEEKEINVEGDKVTAINQDITPPTITGSATTQPNINGWYNGDVIIHFEAADNESGIDFVTPDVTITAEGKDQSVTGTAKDKAGNEASFTVSGINIDKTVPNVEFSSPEAKTYLNNQIIAVNYSVSDNLGETTAEIFYDGKDFFGNSIDLSLQNLGEHKFKITAIDEAGNSGEKEINFQIETNIKSIIDNVNHYSALSLIKNKADKVVLISRLKLIQEIEKLIKMTENNWFLKNKTKEKLVRVFEEQINRHLDWMIDYVEKRLNPKVKNGIDQKIGSLLIESLDFIKYN